MVNLICDSANFETISESLKKVTFRIADKVNRLETNLLSCVTINDKSYQNLYASGSSPGILYGLPKIHKTNFSTEFQMRPIFAAYSTPTYKLAKFLVPLLTPFSLSQYCVKNSASFAKEICGLDFITRDSYMASLDIESLYTNVPLLETINICLERVFTSGCDSVAGFTRKLLRETVELAVRSSFFIFNEKLYIQKDGLGMGLPLAPTFANMFLSHHEEIWLDQYPLEFKPLLYRRYFDDCFVIFKCKSHLQNRPCRTFIFFFTKYTALT